MRISLLLFFTLFTWICCAQPSPADQKKIDKLLEGKFTYLPSSDNYSFHANCAPCEVDTSKTWELDTSGIHLHHEYLMYRNPISFKKESESFKVIREDFVSVNEYREFQAWIRDSIAREKLFYCMEADSDANKFLQGKDFAKPAHREENRGKSYLNWKIKLDYDDPEYVPCLSDMYLPWSERYYKKRIIDERKLLYRSIDTLERLRGMSYTTVQSLYPEVSEGTPIELLYRRIPSIVDWYAWARNSTSVQDEPAVLAQLYHSHFESYPITGLTGMQASAFCHWKGKQLEQQIRAMGLSYDVVVTLPTFSDQQLVPNSYSALVVPEKDYSSQWNIDSSAYANFMASVRDSLLYEYLYFNLSKDEDALAMIDEKEVRFGEGMLDWVELDPADRELNRMLFPFSENIKLKKNDEVKALTAAFNAMNLPLYYRYFVMQAGDRAYEGKEFTLLHDEGISRTYWILTERDSMGYPVGKDLVLDLKNNPFESSGVRSHANRQRFIELRNIALQPDATKASLPFMQRISYEQAMAYYHWQKPLYKATENDDWQEFVLPTREQFEALQKGESIRIASHSIDYPTPLFRYVVHFYPVR